MNHRTIFLLIAVVVPICGLFLFQEVQGRHVGTPLSVMTFNVGTFDGKSADIRKIAGIAAGAGVPDVMILQELRGEDACRYLSDALGLPYRVFSFYPVGKIDGLAVISRYPVNILKSFPFNHYGALAVEALVDSTRILVCSVHLERIGGIGVSRTGVNVGFGRTIRILRHEVFMETERSRAVTELLDWISSRNYPYVIISGDFNTIPVSRSIRRVEAGYSDSLWPRMDYLTGTYNHTGWPFSPRIDYIFHSANIAAIESFVVRDSGGDHYPVRAVLMLDSRRDAETLRKIE